MRLSVVEHDYPTPDTVDTQSSWRVGDLTVGMASSFIEVVIIKWRYCDLDSEEHHKLPLVRELGANPQPQVSAVGVVGVGRRGGGHG